MQCIFFSFQFISVGNCYENYKQLLGGYFFNWPVCVTLVLTVSYILSQEFTGFFLSFPLQLSGTHIPCAHSSKIGENLLFDKEVLIILQWNMSANGIFTAKYQITVQKFKKASKSYRQSGENEPAGLRGDLRNGWK